MEPSEPWDAVNCSYNDGTVSSWHPHFKRRLLTRAWQVLLENHEIESHRQRVAAEEALIHYEQYKLQWVMQQWVLRTALSCRCDDLRHTAIIGNYFLLLQRGMKRLKQGYTLYRPLPIDALKVMNLYRIQKLWQRWRRMVYCRRYIDRYYLICYEWKIRLLSQAFSQWFGNSQRRRVEIPQIVHEMNKYRAHCVLSQWIDSTAHRIHRRTDFKGICEYYRVYMLRKGLDRWILRHKQRRSISKQPPPVIPMSVKRRFKLSSNTFLSWKDHQERVSQQSHQLTAADRYYRHKRYIQAIQQWRKWQLSAQSNYYNSHISARSHCELQGQLLRYLTRWQSYYHHRAINNRIQLYYASKQWKDYRNRIYFNFLCRYCRFQRQRRLLECQSLVSFETTKKKLCFNILMHATVLDGSAENGDSLLRCHQKILLRSIWSRWREFTVLSRRSRSYSHEYRMPSNPPSQQLPSRPYNSDCSASISSTRTIDLPKPRIPQFLMTANHSPSTLTTMTASPSSQGYHYSMAGSYRDDHSLAYSEDRAKESTEAVKLKLANEIKQLAVEFELYKQRYYERSQSLLDS